ncbi:MAG: C25 family cysteine peptidase [candidate division KSB1 bacterium]|nr:C25 family cysteine peptidase [candidate division KSB1 bacterium]
MGKKPIEILGIATTVIYITFASILAKESCAPVVLEQDERHVVFSFVTPSVLVSPAEGIGGMDYCLPSIAGCSQNSVPGEPALPQTGLWLTLPPNTLARLEIIDQEIETRRLPRILPAPRLETSAFSEDRTLIYDEGEVYKRSTFFPSAHIVLGKEGLFRGQRMISYRFFPLRVNPMTGEAQFCRSLKAAVYFDAVPGRDREIRLTDTTPDPLLSALTINHQSVPKILQKAQAVPLEDYFLDRGTEWYKLTIPQTGLYRLTASDLRQAGMRLESPPRRLALFCDGKEVAVRMQCASLDRWSDGDAVEFFAVAYKDYYNSENVYWLTPDGGSDGLRMQEQDAYPKGDDLINRGIATYRLEIDRIRRADFPGHTDNERWFMDDLRAPKTLTYPLPINSIDPSGAAFLKFRIQAYAQSQSVFPDHHTQILINDQIVYDKFWDGRVTLFDSTVFSTQLLKASGNTLKIVGPGDTDSFLDWVLVDWFELRYPRVNSADSEALYFTLNLDAPKTVVLQNLAGTVDLYDVTDPFQPKRLVNAEQQGDRRLFRLPQAGVYEIFAVQPPQKLKPSKISADEISSLRKTLRQTDYFMITVPEFVSALTPLAERHRQDGLNVAIIDVQDIYDEFNYGKKSERAIRRFLTYAMQMFPLPAPRYVLLVGDASWNPRRLNSSNPNYGGEQATDFIPTRLFESLVDYFEACSDNWLACVDGEDDILPDLLVGRLPARSADEVRQMVQKILLYHQTAAEPSMRRAVFVADIGEGGTMAFEDTSSSLASRFVPPTVLAEALYISRSSATEVRKRLLEIFGEGALTINYFGHGSVGNWSKHSILTRAEVPLLPRGRFFPFVFTMSCINGYFADPNPANSSLTEMLFNQDQAGIIGGFSAAGEAYPSPLFPLARMLYDALYQKGITRLGEFCTAGLFTMYADYPFFDDHVRFYILFGDPACRLQYQPERLADAGFAGQIRFNDGRKVKGKTLTAFISRQTVAQTTINSEKGAFGPIYIPPDNPETPVREGGVAGDTVTFVFDYPQNPTQLFPTALWKGGQLQRLALSEFPTFVAEQPEVKFFINGEAAEPTFADGDPLQRDAVIEIRFQCSHEYGSGDPVVRLNRQILDLSATRRPITDGLAFTLPVNTLSDGEYELSVHEPESAAKPLGVLRFRIASTLRLLDVVNFPNPCADQTVVSFVLENDKPARVTLKLFTISGRLIYKTEGEATVGYNAIPYDLCDTAGEKLANGLYFYRLSAFDGEEKAEVIERLVVMQ